MSSKLIAPLALRKIEGEQQGEKEEKARKEKATKRRREPDGMDAAGKGEAFQGDVALCAPYRTVLSREQCWRTTFVPSGCDGNQRRER